MSSNSLLRIITTCAYNPCSRAIILSGFDLTWYVLRFVYFFLQWSKIVLGINFFALKYELSITSYIDIQFFWLVLAMFSMSRFIASWYSKVFLSSSIIITFSLSLRIFLSSSEFVSVSSVVFYCIFLFFCFPSYASLIFIKIWCSFKELIYI